MIDIHRPPVLPRIVLMLPGEAAHFIDLPDPRRLIRLHRFAAHLTIEQPGNGQRIVADEFRIEAMSWATSEQAIIRILFEVQRRDP